jgi:hypothetical protein
MRPVKSQKEEYRKVCEAMENLERKAGHGKEPLPEDRELYMRLVQIKKTLEWAFPRLIRTKSKGADRIVELMGHKHYRMGPTSDLLYP